MTIQDTKYKVIDYKKQRDEAVNAFVMFRKLGDNKMAEAYLNLAVRLNQLRTDIEPVVSFEKL